MKRRTLKKNGLQTAIDNAHDIAVTEMLLRRIWTCMMNNHKLVLTENPFSSKTLNDELWWVCKYFNERYNDKPTTQTL